jgi:hypothetical protein
MITGSVRIPATSHRFRPEMMIMVDECGSA